MDDTLCLLGLSEDVIIQICSFLSPLDLCRLAVCCRRLYDIGKLNVVWSNACRFHILANGYPFRSRQLSSDESASVQDLRSRVLDAYLLAERWQTGMMVPTSLHSISGALGTSVSDIRFLPDNKLLITVSKTIWSTLSIWHLHGDGGLDGATMVADWSPRGVIITCLVVNEKEGSDGSVAISALLDGVSTLKIFNVAKTSDFTFDLREVYSENTIMEPVSLSANILVLADAATHTVVRNWKDGTRAILRIPPDDPPSQRSDQCLQTLFAHESVLVVRAHAVYLFPNPILIHSEDPTVAVYDAIAQYSFGWVDGISAAICPYLSTNTTAPSPSTQLPGSTLWPPISILVRGQSDDPWARDAHYLALNTLFPNPEYPPSATIIPTCVHATLPYIFPPEKTYQVKCRRGVLRCRQLRLGKYGTAVWLAPRERYSMGLVTGFLSPVSDSDEDQWRWRDKNVGQQNESLRVGAFPGSLSSSSSSEISVTNLVENEAHNWTCFDYDEVGGRIVVASSFGKILVVGL